MLREIRIQNIILIETAHIEFVEGFNVISGETGSGKSAIMHAIALIAGERADVSMLRKDADKGTVDAIFDIQGITALENILEQAGIDSDENHELYIRREISSSGKSRAFINNQLVQLNLLRTVITPLLNIVGQHANQDLLSIDHHREILDLFGGLREEVVEFYLNWDKENILQEELNALINNEAQRLREIEVCQAELEELDEAQLKEGEDEELFAEYTLLVHAEEIGRKVEEVLQTLNGERTAVLPHLYRQKQTFDSLVEIDSSLTELSNSFQNALIELKEISSSLNIYQSRLEQNPEKLEEVNQRLTLISKLKKKYGSSLEEIEAFAQAKRARLSELLNADNRIEELQEQLHEIQKKNHQLAANLTLSRKQMAQKLAQALKDELASLNMPRVDFQIDVLPQKRNRWGDDRVEFFLLPNVGEHRIPIKDCASGGELSRVMLSLQTVLSGKQKIPTLIFDEIDANIGGETARIVGEKLRAIGQDHQVLCITHFPQVAKFADHHLQISKKIVDDRTVTLVNIVTGTERENEIARMMG